MRSSAGISASEIRITGIVQGVGFRPFLFQLAHEHALAGEVSNTGQGVTLVVEGPEDGIRQFCRDIEEKAPALAVITGIRRHPRSVRDFKGFSIIPSRSGSGGKTTLISPDVSVCEDCLAELTDPADRRFEYPFINCTNCGPRYTIIRDVPYDRPKTSMAFFPMCPACRKEYDDPMDRRFHAQPNACPECGPQVFLTDSRGRRLEPNGETVLQMAGRLLRKGHILAVKGLGGFHLAVNAADDEGVSRLRRLKGRPHKPFALMARSLKDLTPHVHIDSRESSVLTSRFRPIVLLKKKNRSHEAAGLSSAVAPGNPYLGVMLPYTPLHYILLEKGPPVLVMTSGNPSGEPLSIDNTDAVDAFSHMADFFLLHDRDIYFRADDSIVQVQEDRPRFFRRSRGYAPMPVFLDQDLPPVLACGGGLKSTVCLAREDRAFLSQHIGDLDNEKVFGFFKKSISHLQRILDIHPEAIAHDLHPGYFSTTWALEQPDDLPRVAVQHHHAHAVACMAENRLSGPVIAVTLDGTGLGSDGHIWGGEVLVCTLDDFKRHAHLKYFPMPGGDAAVRAPWRMAAAVLRQLWGRGMPEMDFPLIHRIGRDKMAFMVEMMEKKIHCPLTSSCGRLFDAMAALVGIRDEITFESQAAMDLQALAMGYHEDGYEMTIEAPKGEQDDEGLVMDPGPGMAQAVADIMAGVPRGVIAARFHGMVIHGFCRAVTLTAEKTELNQVVLSGGVFNNHLVLSGILKGLETTGLQVATHRHVPAGDGGISLGQAVIAGHQIRGRSNR